MPTSTHSYEIVLFKDEMEKRDNPKSKCCMKESGVNEDEARAYIKTLMIQAWKKLDEERARADSQFAREFIEGTTNMARISSTVMQTVIFVKISQKESYYHYYSVKSKGYNWDQEWAIDLSYQRWS